MVLLVTILNFRIDAYAADQYKGGIVIEDGAPKVVEEGLMPSTGDVKAAVLTVEFADLEATLSKDEVSSLMFGEGDSVTSYYKNSSYDKLNISGDVYDWYATENTRTFYEEYFGEYSSNEYLFREVLTAMDSQIDFSQYDSDDDGYVDAVYLIYAGEEAGFGSTWWAYMIKLMEELTVDEKKIAQFVIMPEYFDYMTAAHETGHAMGLQDYYDTDMNVNSQSYYGTESLMCSSTGDLDILSKWMLGWITPQSITEDKTISLRPSNEYPDAALIKTNVEGIDDAFFLIEYRTSTNNYKESAVNGVSVFRVNAAIDPQTGSYMYDVSSSEVRLIERVAIDVESGFAMGNLANPISYIVQEDGENVQYIPTGIIVDNINIVDGVATLDITYGDAIISGSLDYEKTNLMADSRIGYTFDFPVGVNYVGEDLIATDGNHEITVKVYRDIYSDTISKNKYFLYTTEQVKPNTTYTIDIPEGVFVSFDGRENEEEKLQITTSAYGDKKEYTKAFGSEAYMSQSLTYGDGGFVYFTNEDGDLCMNTVDAAGNKQRKVLYEMGEQYSDGMIWTSIVQACMLDDGSYVVTAREYTNNTIFKIKEDGTVDYVNTIELDEPMILSAVGNTALLGMQDGSNYMVLTGDNQIDVADISDIYSPLIKCGDRYVCITESETGAQAVIYDEELNLIGAFPNSNSGSVIGVDIVDGKMISFENCYNDEEQAVEIYAFVYNEDESLLEKVLISKSAETGINYSKVIACQSGYVFVGTKDLMVEDNYFGSMEASIANIMVTDKSFNALYKCSLNRGAYLSKEVVVGVSESGDNIVCSTINCDYVLQLSSKDEPVTPPTEDDPVAPPSEDDPVTPPVEQTPPAINVYYRTHIQSFGWEGEADKVSTWKKNGDVSGTSGKAKRLEGIQIEVESSEAGKDIDLGIQYTTHCQSYGWLPWSASGEMSGTTGESKRLEAIKIQLTGADKDKYDVHYRVHAQSYGWLDWASNGEPAGTAGYGKRLESIQIVVVKKGESFNKEIGGISSKEAEAYIAKSGLSPVLGQAATDAINPEIKGADAPYVMYKTHVQSFGWQQWVYNGAMSGTEGKAKRLEGINIKLSNAPYQGGIVYTTHVQSYGWKDGNPETDKSTWKGKNGSMSGTSGEAKRLEAICIDLTGEMAEHYDVYYRVHAQSYGWLGWAKNGEEAGSEGLSKRLEGIQIVLVKKGEAAPANNYGGITSTSDKAFVK